MAGFKRKTETACAWCSENVSKSAGRRFQVTNPKTGTTINVVCHTKDCTTAYRDAIETQG